MVCINLLTNRLEQEKRNDDNRRLRAAFYVSNPPLPLTSAPEIQTESELFDILARYHIAEVECSFYARYHWGEFECIENLTIWTVSLPSNIQTDFHELPADDEGVAGDIISEAVKSMASERASQAACLADGRIQEDGGTITFDVLSRRISVDATVEVTREEGFEMSWAPDEDEA
jgi:hypothetical protein